MGRLTTFARRPIVLVAAAVLIGGAAVVLVWFQPQRLLYDTTVDEELPVATEGGSVGGGATDDPADASGATDSPGPGEGRIVQATGEFRGMGRYDTEGTALLLELDEGDRFVRLEDFRTTNGPDLYVYLSAARADGPESAHDDDFVDLGRLRGNVGNQNYEVPGEVDLDLYRTVVIWCRRFSVGFGVAELT